MSTLEDGRLVSSQLLVCVQICGFSLLMFASFRDALLLILYFDGLLLPMLPTLISVIVQDWLLFHYHELAELGSQTTVSSLLRLITSLGVAASAYLRVVRFQ